MATNMKSDLARIRPPYCLYTLHAEAGWMGSPGEPVVHIVRQDSGSPSATSENLRPDQARELAAQLTAAADAAEVCA